MKELFNAQNISDEILHKFRTDTSRPLLLHSNYRVSVIIPNIELQPWAQMLIDEGHLMHVIAESNS